jgi:hypothetical protein
LVATAALLSSHAAAEESDRAKGLFKAGVAEMMAGNYASGCPKIGSAYVMTRGTGALFTLAECYAQWGKPLAAHGHYREYLKRYARLSAEDRKRQAERAELATTQMAALGALVPTLRIVIPGGERSRATVTVDGKKAPRGALSGPVKLEVGEHEVVVTTADGERVSRRFELAEGEEQQWEVDLEGSSDSGDGTGRSGDTGQESSSSGFTSTQIAGFVVGGIGVAGLAVGGITGGLAVGKKGVVEDHCDELLCDQEGLDAANSGDMLGNVSTVTLAVGGAALVTGILLLALGSEDVTTGALQVRPEGVRWTF